MTKVYFIEDGPIITHSVKEYLEQYNFHVTIFITIGDARSAVKTMLPQILLLDWDMSDGRSDRFCRWIRYEWKQLPIIFLTVRNDVEDSVAEFGDALD